MPRANWEIDPDVIDDWDRSKQYTPYTGPIPPNAVYAWRIKKANFKAGTNRTKPQLSVGLELIPRSRDENQYSGYFAWKSAFISPKNQFTYVPFLDAIGVTSSDFTKRTIVDEEGNIKRIGAWKNDGETVILGQLEDNTYTNSEGATVNSKAISWCGAYDGEVEDPEDDEEYPEDDGDDTVITDDYDDDDGF